MLHNEMEGSNNQDLRQHALIKIPVIENIQGGKDEM